MALVCWGMVGKSYGQDVPTLTENNIAKIWDKTLGSNGTDLIGNIIKTKDNGFIIVGFSGNDFSGDKSQDDILGEGWEIWVVKIDAQGHKVWDKTFGGNNSETKPIIASTNDGNYIILATSNSYISGDKTQDAVGFLSSDYWLIKIDGNGNKIWDKTYGGTDYDEATSIISCKDNGFLLGGLSSSDIGENKTQTRKGGYDYWVIKTDANGNQLWDATFGGTSNDNLSNMVEFEQGFLLGGNSGSNDGDNTTSSSGDWFIKIDKNGKKIWDKNYQTSGMATMTVTKDNFIVFATNFASNHSISKINEDGQLVWQKTVPRADSIRCLTILEDNTMLSFSTSRLDNYISYLSPDGNLLWIETLKNMGGRIDYIGNNEFLFYTSTDKNIGGLKSENSRGGSYDYWVIKFTGRFNSKTNRITGSIYNDLNTNCQLNPNETGLRNILVRATPGNYNTFTDEKGNYTLYLDDIGTYKVTPNLSTRQQSLLSPTCSPNSQTISFTSLGNIKSDVNFGYKVTPCATLTVDISSNRRRRCFRSFTTVKYANEGYAAADNVQLKVIYPQYVVPIRSSVAWTSRQDTVITYNLGRLAAGQTGQIVITDSVICGNESIRGLTQCTKAIISPKSTCITNNPNWDKADLQAFSQCVGAKNVKLSVVNTGEAMRDSTAWRLFLNGVLKQQGRLKLGKGENYSFEILAKGNTVRLEADQTPNHPVGQYALTTIERCGGVIAFSAVLPPPSVQLPININASGEEIATSCMPILDSYDPNDKQVIPAGVGTSNIVRDADELEFQVRFQNTGSDTAYTVIIRDTLSTALDIASLQVGASSHNYTYTVSGKNNPIITWTFDKINLPAQKQNDLGSNGFVKFKIAQMPNNAKGTKIKNKAGIYFDFNSPIITNETNLTVGDLVSDLNNAADLATIFVCNNKPQPTSSQAGTDKTTVADSLVLSANIAEKGTGIWKVVQGTGVFTNASNPKTTVKKIGLGENIYEWSVSLCNTISASKVKITKVATPKAEITTKGDTLIVEIADSYQWFLNGQAISGATSQSFIAKTNGTYTVEIKKFGVTVISPAFKHTITGIEDELLQKSTTLIPNPAQNICVLQVSNDYFGEVKLSISNLLGQIVFQTVIDKNEINLSQTLDLQHFANGIYFVYLQTAKGKVVKKLVRM